MLWAHLPCTGSRADGWRSDERNTLLVSRRATTTAGSGAVREPEDTDLVTLTIDDVDEATRVFELLMGSDVAPRKEFIVQGAYEVDVESLDA